jgi:hypothetical protein
VTKEQHVKSLSFTGSKMQTTNCKQEKSQKTVSTWLLSHVALPGAAGTHVSGQTVLPAHLFPAFGAGARRLVGKVQAAAGRVEGTVGCGARVGLRDAWGSDGAARRWGAASEVAVRGSGLPCGERSAVRRPCAL